MKKFVRRDEIAVSALSIILAIVILSVESNATADNHSSPNYKNESNNEFLIADVFTDEGFKGNNTMINNNTPSLTEPFHDSISSLIITNITNSTGGYMVEVCEHISYAGNCMVLGPGKYDIESIGSLNDKIDSIRFLSPNTLKLKGLS